MRKFSRHFKYLFWCSEEHYKIFAIFIWKMWIAESLLVNNHHCDENIFIDHNGSFYSNDDELINAHHVNYCNYLLLVAYVEIPQCYIFWLWWSKSFLFIQKLHLQIVFSINKKNCLWFYIVMRKNASSSLSLHYSCHKKIKNFLHNGSWEQFSLSIMTDDYKFNDTYFLLLFHLVR